MRIRRTFRILSLRIHCLLLGVPQHSAEQYRSECLYVGNLKFNWRMKNYIELISDKKYESRDNTLLLRSRFFCRILKKEGFKILKIGINRKKPWIKKDGNQNYAVIIS